MSKFDRWALASLCWLPFVGCAIAFDIPFWQQAILIGTSGFAIGLGDAIRSDSTSTKGRK